MTATDELRRLLDERGMEHFDGTETTLWGYEPTSESTGVYRFAADETSGGRMQVRMFNLTPEQAIEVTLGQGECRNLIAHIQGQMPMLHCEECGCTTTLNVPSGGAGYIGETAMDWPLFCANCGKKVRA